VSCCVWVAEIEEDGGATVTVATGSCAIVTVAVPLALPLVAVIVTVPLSFAPVGETSPVFDTVATAELLDDHVTVRPVSVAPLASVSVAVSCCVCVAEIFEDGGATATLATGSGVTVTVAMPLFPPVDAVIVTVPLSFAPVAETRPVFETVATLGLLDVQVTVRPASTVPPPSLTVAVSCCVCVALIVDEVGATETLPTGSCPIVTVAVPPALPLVAVMVTVPVSLSPVDDTRPVFETVATDGLLEDHAIGRPLSVVPPASVSVAVSCCV
jgi:hypothetical protein